MVTCRSQAVPMGLGLDSEGRLLHPDGATRGDDSGCCRRRRGEPGDEHARSAGSAPTRDRQGVADRHVRGVELRPRRAAADTESFDRAELAVDAVEFAVDDAVIGMEVEGPIGDREFGRPAVLVGSRPDVTEHLGPGGCAVGGEQFAADQAVVGTEEDPVAGAGQERWLRTPWARVEVFEERRSGQSSVGDVEFVAERTGGAEVDLAAELGVVPWPAALDTWLDIGNAKGARRSEVRSPDLGSVQGSVAVK